MGQVDAVSGASLGGGIVVHLVQRTGKASVLAALGRGAVIHSSEVCNLALQGFLFVLVVCLRVMIRAAVPRCNLSVRAL